MKYYIEGQPISTYMWLTEEERLFLDRFSSWEELLSNPKVFEYYKTNPLPPKSLKEFATDYTREKLYGQT